MQRKTRKIIGAVALIGALAAGGAAFTAGNPLTNQTQSYSSANISGALANTLAFTYSTDGSRVIGATVTLAGDETDVTGPNRPYKIDAGFTGTLPYAGAIPPLPGDPTPADDLGSLCHALPALDGVNTDVVCDFTSTAGDNPATTTTTYSADPLTPGYVTQQTNQFNLLVTGHDTTTTTGS